MKAVTLIQVCSAEDEHDSASLMRRVQEMNCILQGVQAHYAESDVYVVTDQLYAGLNGNTREFRSHFNRVWDSNAHPCTEKVFRTWWLSWVEMLQFELNYIVGLEQSCDKADRESSENAHRTWDSYLKGLRVQVDNTVRIMQEVRHEVLKIIPTLDLPGFPDVPKAAELTPDDKRWIKTAAEVVADVEMERGRHEAIRELARQYHQKDGELEFDPDAKVSEGEENGAYVQGWKWVSFRDTALDKVS
jgi:hypothetical protein